MDNNTPTNDMHIVSTAVFSVLSALDLHSAIAFRQLFGECTDQSVNAQLYHANRFWRNQLAHLDCDAARFARMALQDNVDLHDWIRSFSAVVAPLIVQNELPSSYRGRGLAEQFDAGGLCDRLLASCTPSAVAYG